MAKHDEAAGWHRRNFLKTAVGTGMVLLAAKDAYGQSAPPTTATQAEPGRSQPADRGLWVTWYDLPDKDRDAYLSWLHGTYLPEVLRRPGYLWAAHYATRDIEGGSNSPAYH